MRWFCCIAACAARRVAASQRTRRRAWPTQARSSSIVPFPAGGQLDVVSRLIADRISPALGQPIIVEAQARRRRQHRRPKRWRRARPTATRGSRRARRRRSSRACGRRRCATIRCAISQAVAFIGTSPFLFVVPASLPVEHARRNSSPMPRRSPASCRMPARRAAPSCTLPPSCSSTTPGSAMEMISYQGQPSAIADLITGRVQFMTLGRDTRRAADQGGQAEGAGGARRAALRAAARRADASPSSATPTS